MNREKLNLSDNYYIEKFIPDGRLNYRYEIFNNKEKMIGYFKYDGIKKKYFFYPLDEDAYTRQILREINLFLEEINGKKGVKRGELLEKTAQKWYKKRVK